MTIIPIYLEPKFNHMDIVEVQEADGVWFVGEIRIRSYGSLIKKVPPIYGILPDNNSPDSKSFKHMITAPEHKVRLASIETLIARANHQSARSEELV
jgi:hypothetical protein